LPYLLNSISTVECRGDGEYPLVRGIDKFVVDILNEVVLAVGLVRILESYYETHLGKPSELIINRTDCLLEGFLERPTYAHYLTDTLHAAA
jgi:hypothetical protein